MSNSRFEITRFDGDGDFSLWRIRMLAHIRGLGLKDVLTDHTLELVSNGQEGSSSATTSSVVLDPAKVERSEKVIDLIMSNIGDHVLRKIKNCETAAAMWETLERLYTESSLPNRIHVQLKFYTFRMVDSKSINENVDEFLKIVAEMSSLDISVTDEVQAVLLLTSLSPQFDQLKHTLKYGRDLLTLEQVISAARSKERELADMRLERGSGSALFVRERGRQSKRFPKESGGQHRSKSGSRTRRKCWFCHKEGHLRKDCSALRRQGGSSEGPGEA